MYLKQTHLYYLIILVINMTTCYKVSHANDRSSELVSKAALVEFCVSKTIEEPDLVGLSLAIELVNEEYHKLYETGMDSSKAALESWQIFTELTGSDKFLISAQKLIDMTLLKMPLSDFQLQLGDVLEEFPNKYRQSIIRIIEKSIGEAQLSSTSLISTAEYLVSDDKSTKLIRKSILSAIRLGHGNSQFDSLLNEYLVTWFGVSTAITLDSLTSLNSQRNLPSKALSKDVFSSLAKNFRGESDLPSKLKDRSYTLITAELRTALSVAGRVVSEVQHIDVTIPLAGHPILTKTREEIQTTLSESEARVRIAANVVNLVDPDAGKFIEKVSDEAFKAARTISAVGDIGSALLTGNILGAVDGLTSLFGISGPSEYEILSDQIGELQSQVSALSSSMHDRFDQVDRRLNQIYETLESRFDEINEKLVEQTKQMKSGFAEVQRTNKELLKIQREIRKSLNGLRTEIISIDRKLTEGFESLIEYEVAFNTNACLDVFELKLDTCLPCQGELPSLYHCLNFFGTLGTQLSQNLIERRGWNDDEIKEKSLTNVDFVSEINRSFEIDDRQLNTIVTILGRLGNDRVGMIGDPILPSIGAWVAATDASTKLMNQCGSFCSNEIDNTKFIDTLLSQGNRIASTLLDIGWVRNGNRFILDTAFIESVIGLYTGFLDSLEDRLWSIEKRVRSRDSISTQKEFDIWLAVVGDNLLSLTSSTFSQSPNSYGLDIDLSRLMSDSAFNRIVIRENIVAQRLGLIDLEHRNTIEIDKFFTNNMSPYLHIIFSTVLKERFIHLVHSLRLVDELDKYGMYIGDACCLFYDLTSGPNLEHWVMPLPYDALPTSYIDSIMKLDDTSLILHQIYNHPREWVYSNWHSQERKLINAIPSTFSSLLFEYYIVSPRPFNLLPRRPQFYDDYSGPHNPRAINENAATVIGSRHNFRMILLDEIIFYQNGLAQELQRHLVDDKSEITPALNAIDFSLKVLQSVIELGFPGLSESNDFVRASVFGDSRLLDGQKLLTELHKSYDSVAREFIRLEQELQNSSVSLFWQILSLVENSDYEGSNVDPIDNTMLKLSDSLFSLGFPLTEHAPSVVVKKIFDDARTRANMLKDSIIAAAQDPQFYRYYPVENRIVQLVLLNEKIK